MDAYQRIVRTLRRRNRLDGWPGKPLNAPAVSRYPNIAAEILASSGFLWCPAEHAGVSKEILAAVLEDNEELTCVELLGLCRLFDRKVSYMANSTLQMVDPLTNKGKYRLRQLSDLLKQVEDMEIIGIWKVEQVRDAMERGEPVTFAAWKRGCQEIREELERRKPIERRSTRIGRVVTA